MFIEQVNKKTKRVIRTNIESWTADTYIATDVRDESTWKLVAENVPEEEADKWIRDNS